MKSYFDTHRNSLRFSVCGLKCVITLATSIKHTFLSNTSTWMWPIVCRHSTLSKSWWIKNSHQVWCRPSSNCGSFYHSQSCLFPVIPSGIHASREEWATGQNVVGSMWTSQSCCVRRDVVSMATRPGRASAPSAGGRSTNKPDTNRSRRTMHWQRGVVVYLSKLVLRRPPAVGRRR